jgi:hypothetical protein
VCSLLYERLEVVDKLFFVEILLLGIVGLVDMLFYGH